MYTKRWECQATITSEAEAGLTGYPRIIQQILFNRGIATLEEAKSFFSAEPTFNTSPWQMKGLSTAAERIAFAIEHEELIAIYGDYDVDGVTATALLVSIIRDLGGSVVEYIPNRFDEGYGLNKEALDSLIGRGVGLVVTVDCGIRSPDEAKYARKIGLDLIITDHHQPAGSLPQAVAVINPKQQDDDYPEKDLAGVGIAYKLAQGLCELFSQRRGRPTYSNLIDNTLDLVALGTVADLAPLTGENRSLVREGLKQIRQTQRQGLFSLANVSGISLHNINANHIGFGLGPRLNASGRLESAIASYELLMTSEVRRAGDLAQLLDNQNRERQRLTRDIQEKAQEIALADDPQPLLMFAAHPEFNPGVVGLAAARLTETHYRPAIVGHMDEDTTRCSCRSIPEFNITHALDECADMLIRYGGHAAAAGFTVRNENLTDLIDRLRSIAGKELHGRDLRQTLVADVEVSLSELKPKLLTYLALLEPTGYGNLEAIFISHGVQVSDARKVGADGHHLKLKLTDGRITFDAIAFRLGFMFSQLTPMIDILYTFEKNEYNGREYLQLRLHDLKIRK